MKTATLDDCRKWLTTNEESQQIVRDRLGWNDDPFEMLEMAGDQEEVDYIKRQVQRASRPKNWIQLAQYPLGSSKDASRHQFNLWPENQNTTGTVWEFSLNETDVAVAILAQDNGEISFLDDLSES